MSLLLSVPISPIFSLTLASGRNSCVTQHNPELLPSPAHPSLAFHGLVGFGTNLCHLLHLNVHFGCDLTYALLIWDCASPLVICSQEITTVLVAVHVFCHLRQTSLALLPFAPIFHSDEHG